MPGGTDGTPVDFQGYARLLPVDHKQQEELLTMFRSVQRLDDHRFTSRASRTALDAAARFVAIMRYDAPGDPIAALDVLDKALRCVR